MDYEYIQTHSKKHFAASWKPFSLVLDKDTGGYIPFTIDLKYVSDKEPGYLFIAVLASRLGEYFTGSSKSVIYVDEFTFNY